MNIHNIANAKRPNKKEFLKLAKSMSRDQRMNMARELVHFVQEKTTGKDSGYIPYGVKREMRMLISQVMANKKHFSAKKLFKLYIVGCYPAQEIQHWNIIGSQCWRQKRVHKDNSQVGRTRRTTIRGWNGDNISRAWLDKFLPHIKTQADYDRHMTEKNGIDKLQKDDLLKANSNKIFTT